MEISTHPLADPIPGTPGLQIDRRLVRSLRLSLGRLLNRGDALARTFYDLLFERNPELRVLFPKDMAAQHSKLLDMLSLVVATLDRPDQTLPVLCELGQRHLSYGTSARHYPLVCDALLQAMQQTATEDWTAELSADWRGTLDQISRHMIAGAAAARTADGAAPVSPPSATSPTERR